MNTSLDTLSRAERMLAEVATASDAISMMDMAEAARVWAQRTKLGTASINHATAIKLKAEIKLAEVVDEGQRRGEIASKGKRPSADNLTRDKVIRSLPPTCEDLGLSHKRLFDARKIRDAYTPEAIDELVQAATNDDREITRREFLQPKAHVSYNSGENEWNTPRHFIDAARAAMGSIDIDPASNANAQEWIQAGQFFTKDDSGLEKPWIGNVWLNPPYAQPLIMEFCEKVCKEFDAGNIGQAIVLVNNGTDTKWGQLLIARASAVCFPAGRIKFTDQNGQPGSPLQGQMVVYLGNQPERFRSAFTELGVTLHGR